MCKYPDEYNHNVNSKKLLYDASKHASSYLSIIKKYKIYSNQNIEILLEKLYCFDTHLYFDASFFENRASTKRSKT